MDTTDKRLVAISYNDKDKCKELLKVCNVSENEYRKLKSEQLKYESEKAIDYRDKTKLLESHETKINKLEGNRLYLAKVIYDRFVDRGYINENKEFDKAFYDFIFNNVPLDLDNAPEEFKIICKKVGE